MSASAGIRFVSVVFGAVLLAGVGSARAESSASRTVTRNVERTENGVEWTRDREVTGPQGGTRSTHTEGSATRTEDGSRSWSSKTTGTRTTPGGEQRGWSTERSGSSAKNEQGGRDFERSRTTTDDRGRTWTRTTTGSGGSGKAGRRAR